MERIKIVLRNGKTVETDDIESIDFSLRNLCITIRGWKDGLNQTEDVLSIEEVKRIVFPRREE